MLYRYKVAIFAGIVAALTSFLVYITSPSSRKVPTIRVLYISHSDYAVVKRLSSSSPLRSPDESIQVLKISSDGSVTVSREEWNLKSTTEEFYQNNLVLECSASFSVTWKYSGFGEPSITEENIRIHGNFNDSDTFSFISLLNLMPLTEKATGKYTCYGSSNDTFQFFSSVHLFIPGDSTFLIDYDTTIQAPGEANIFVPCPVTNASANVTLYFKNQAVTSDNINNLLTFDPQTGFYLKPRFVEEQSDPWGQFQCKVEDTREKSGIITIQPIKGLIVNAIPESSTVFLTQPSTLSSTSNKNNKLEDQYQFICQAKEEIALKFLRVVTFPTVRYEYNSSSTFPYTATTEASPKYFRNSSRIYCRTVRNNEDLHSWRILFSSLPMRSELMELNYDPSREEFSCCSSSSKRAKMTFLPCNSISECRIKGYCLQPGRKCNSEEIAKVPERSGCARYKLMKGTINGKDNARTSRFNDDGNSFKLEVDSGLLQCIIDGKSVEKVYFASQLESDNGTVLSSVSDFLKDDNARFNPATIPFMDLNFNQSQLKIMEIFEIKTADVNMRSFLCRGAKFFLALGFLWQTVRVDKELTFYTSRDVIKGPWIESQLQIPTFSANSTKSLKRIYCIAPLWDSRDKGWSHAKLEWISD